MRREKPLPMTKKNGCGNEVIVDRTQEHRRQSCWLWRAWSAIIQKYIYTKRKENGNHLQAHMGIYILYLSSVFSVTILILIYFKLFSIFLKNKEH